MKRERVKGFGTSDVATTAPSVANSALAVANPIAPPTLGPGALFLTTLLLIADLASGATASRISARKSLRISERLANIDVLATPVVPAVPAGPTEVIIDYTGVPDTEDYVDANLLRTKNDCGSDIVSGEMTTPHWFENSFYVPIAVLDLSGATVITITLKQADSGGTNLCAFISDAELPGIVTPVAAAATMTGYRIHYSGGRYFIERIIAGTPTQVGNPTYSSPNNHDEKTVITVSGDRVTFQGYKDDVLVRTVEDTDASRITAFRTAGYAMRNNFGGGSELNGFIVNKA